MRGALRLAWPLISWLCARTDMVFIERGSPGAAHSAKQMVAGRLRNGNLAAVFPEGTTGDGAKLLPFTSHSAPCKGNRTIRQSRRSASLIDLGQTCRYGPRYTGLPSR
jgi:hypothetical protein